MAHQLSTTLLLLDLPPKSFVGIDLASFTSTDRFQGIKLIPPGLHFAYYSAQGEMSLRAGFWFHAMNTDQVTAIIITKYDVALERLIEETEMDTEEAIRIKANLGALYSDHLTIYRQPARDGRVGNTTPEAEQWEALREYVDEAVLLRCFGVGWRCSSVSSSKMDRDQEEEKLMELLKGGDVISEIEWAPVDLKRTWPEGAIGRERTVMAKDRSWALGTVIERLDVYGDGEKQLLGELQVAFIMAVTLGCYSAMEQWRRLLGLTLTCKSAVFGDKKAFFEDLMELLLAQLGYVDESFLAGFVGGGEGEDSWLAKLLRGFGKGLNEVLDDDAEQGKGKGKEIQSETLKMYKEIESLVKKKFDWVLDTKDVVRRGMIQTEEGEMVELEMAGLEEDDETGEYAPVIVQEDVEDGFEDTDMTPAQ